VEGRGKRHQNRNGVEVGKAREKDTRVEIVERERLRLIAKEHQAN